MITTSHESKEPQTTETIFYKHGYFSFFSFSICRFFSLLSNKNVFPFSADSRPISVMLFSRINHSPRDVLYGHIRSFFFSLLYKESMARRQMNRWISTNFFLFYLLIFFFHLSFVFYVRSLYKQVYILTHMTKKMDIEKMSCCYHLFSSRFCKRKIVAKYCQLEADKQHLFARRRTKRKRWQDLLLFIFFSRVLYQKS